MLFIVDILIQGVSDVFVERNQPGLASFGDPAGQFEDIRNHSEGFDVIDVESENLGVPETGGESEKEKGVVSETVPDGFLQEQIDLIIEKYLGCTLIPSSRTWASRPVRFLLSIHAVPSVAGERSVAA